jgi:hypothetical protein
MKGIAGIAGLVIVLGVGYFVYNTYLTKSGPGGALDHPQEQIDVIDIKANLLTIGQAERQYVTAHGSYATIEQLQQEGPPSIGTETRGYVFNAEPDGAKSFTVTATPTDPNKPGWPTLVITESMEVKQR